MAITRMQSVAATVVATDHPSIFNRFLVTLGVAAFRLTRRIKKEKEQPRLAPQIATSSPVFTRGAMRRLFSSLKGSVSQGHRFVSTWRRNSCERALFLLRVRVAREGHPLYIARPRLYRKGKIVLF